MNILDKIQFWKKDEFDFDNFADKEAMKKPLSHDPFSPSPPINPTPHMPPPMPPPHTATTSFEQPPLHTPIAPSMPPPMPSPIHHQSRLS